MRLFILLSIFLLLSLISTAQLSPYYEELKGNVLKEKLINYGVPIRIGRLNLMYLNFLPSHKTFYFYDQDNQVVLKSSDSKGKKWHTKYQRGPINDHQIKITEISRYNSKIDSTITVVTYDSIGRAIKSDMYFRNEDEPQITLSAISYDKQNNIVLVKQKNQFLASGISDSSYYNYIYKEDVYVGMNKLDSYKTIYESWTLKYNKKSQIELKITDYLDPNTTIGGGRVEEGIRREFFKYDKLGNWKKRYFVYSNGKKKIEIKRKFKYRKGV